MAQWFSEWNEFVARDDHGPIGRVVSVWDGWDARTVWTELGVYLTAEMARCAVMGMHHIEVHGSYYGPTKGA